MTFNWEDYLILATELLEESSTLSSEQARFRSAISRAYYATFNEARTFLESREKIIIPQVNVHKYFISQFQVSSNNRRQKIGNRLLVLRAYRN